MRSTRETVILSVALVALALPLVHCTIGCASTSSTIPAAAAELAAEEAYKAEHLKCVDEHDTDDAINACRAEVRRRWAVNDAGAR